MNPVKLILYSLAMVLTCTSICYSASSLHLTWNANSETDLAGYKVYYGTSPGNYGAPIVLGDITEYELSNLAEGVRYYIAVTAYDTSNNESEKSDEESAVTSVTSTTSTTPSSTTTTAVTTTAPTTTTTTEPTTGTALYNGIEDSDIVDPLEEDLYYITIPGGQGYLLVELTGNPDADLYVRYGSPPTTAQFDCRPFTPSSNELCSFSDPDSGIWYIMVQGSSNTVDYTITATYNTGPPPITTTTTTPPPPPTTTTTTTPGTTTTPSTTTTTASGTTTTPSTTTTTASGTTTTPSTTTTTASGTTTTPSTTSTIPVTTTIIATDSTPPTGTVTVNNGIAITHSLNVILTLSARDSGRELNKNEFMSFSNDAISWSDPEPYTTAKLWTLAPDEGIKTVYCQFRDAAGNWMTVPAQDQIMYEASNTNNSCDEPQKLRPVAVSASSQLTPLYSKDYAVDGNPSTTWSTLYSIFGKDEFITLDLGEIKRISWFTMQAASSMFGTDFFPVNFTIETSCDNVTWEAMSTEEGYTPPLHSTRSDTWDLGSLECRYIRVYITKRKTLFLFFKLAQIAEIEVYGCTTSDAPSLLAQDDSSVIRENHDTTQQRHQEASALQQSLDEMLPTIPGTPIIMLSN